MRIRRFLPERLELCAKWFELVETCDAWEDHGWIGGRGNSQPVRVYNAALDLWGVAKPGPPKAQDDWCRAANEKLAFDLAHMLDLPVPPVLLWNEGMPAQFKRGRSISAWAFGHPLDWDKAPITEPMCESARPLFSAIRVFHAWISDGDRGPHNSLVNQDSLAGELELAFVDHDNGMSYVWDTENSPLGPSHEYMPVRRMQEVMVQTADRIAALPDQEVQWVVERIPGPYLPEPKRKYVLSNLLSRKGRLRAMLGLP